MNHRYFRNTRPSREIRKLYKNSFFFLFRLKKGGVSSAKHFYKLNELRTPTERNEGKL